MNVRTLITCRCGVAHGNNTLALLRHIASGCTQGAMAAVIGYPPDGLKRGCASLLERSNRHLRKQMSQWPVIVLPIDEADELAAKGMAARGMLEPTAGLDGAQGWRYTAAGEAFLQRSGRAPVWDRAGSQRRAALQLPLPGPGMAPADGGHRG